MNIFSKKWGAHPFLTKVVGLCFFCACCVQNSFGYEPSILPNDGAYRSEAFGCLITEELEPQMFAVGYIQASSDESERPVLWRQVGADWQLVNLSTGPYAAGRATSIVQLGGNIYVGGYAYDERTNPRAVLFREDSILEIDSPGVWAEITDMSSTDGLPFQGIDAVGHQYLSGLKEGRLWGSPDGIEFFPTRIHPEGFTESWLTGVVSHSRGGATLAGTASSASGTRGFFSYWRSSQWNFDLLGSEFESTQAYGHSATSIAGSGFSDYLHALWFKNRGQDWQTNDLTTKPLGGEAYDVHGTKVAKGLYEVLVGYIFMDSETRGAFLWHPEGPAVEQVDLHATLFYWFGDTFLQSWANRVFTYSDDPQAVPYVLASGAGLDLDGNQQALIWLQKP